MRLLIAAALALPTSLMAAGSEDATTPPKPAVACEGSQVYDKKTKTCVNAEESHLQTDELYQTVRHLAYAGRYDDAQAVLAAMPQDDDRTLTYLGFTNRKMGNLDQSMVFYARAIEQNPGNILARSYMGQGLVETGDVKAALTQLRAIRSHGGTGTWAEASLRQAIATGTTYSY
ncbi:MAG: hypothetical protein WBC93_22970 [Sulfitobacter sp.]